MPRIACLKSSEWASDIQVPTLFIFKWKYMDQVAFSWLFNKDFSIFLHIFLWKIFSNILNSGKLLNSVSKKELI